MEKQTYPTLKAWRDALGLSQRAAAVQLGIPQTAYSRYERGVNTPPVKRLRVIMRRTGVALESLVGLS